MYWYSLVLVAAPRSGNLCIFQALHQIFSLLIWRWQMMTAHQIVSEDIYMSSLGKLPTCHSDVWGSRAWQAPSLHRLLDFPALQAHITGGKGVWMPRRAMLLSKLECHGNCIWLRSVLKAMAVRSWFANHQLTRHSQTGKRVCAGGHKLLPWGCFQITSR